MTKQKRCPENILYKKGRKSCGTVHLIQKKTITNHILFVLFSQIVDIYVKQAMLNKIEERENEKKMMNERNMRKN